MVGEYFFKLSNVIAIDGCLSNIAMNKFLESFSDIERVKNASVFISCKYFLLWNEGIDLGDKIATTYPDFFWIFVLLEMNITNWLEN
ncbi:hypothetical protein PN36_24285 [Candidatus Thiomargarita nelsonii]|uniref:Uncharacterized protein n=1 Tax=Candidatus Thiomargarita nelsonii TaxID=1003181 RepID=A0A4E0QKP0_9GAMM|nr:hypothetical protein PN36_31260 [Candidatus Thiomargarita nelsonii]TGO02479.1 hypothetical protein PN36_24285 [Candidatus Thiomargarita nelsonii]